MGCCQPPSANNTSLGETALAHKFRPFLPSRSPAATIPTTMTFKPLHFFAMALAGWMNREQQDVIAYLHEENRILREKLDHKRVILNESQKRRLATAAAKLGKDLLRQLGTLFSPDTLLKWNRWSGRRGSGHSFFLAEAGISPGRVLTLMSS